MDVEYWIIGRGQTGSVGEEAMDMELQEKYWAKFVLIIGLTKLQ